jgi:hypothetical protein
MVVADVVTDSTDNTMYEDENGNIVFEEDLIEYNTAWSEEDTRLQRKLIELIYSVSYCDERENLSNWLKSLKDRVQPQSKQGCCECDEIDIQTAIEICKNAGYDLIANRLKSLSPQNRWKPSDEQMETLKFACGGNYVDLGVLESLYQDLKKLKS